MARQASRFWCFTINNEKYQNSSLPTTVYEYCIMGNEIGDNGTRHIQGFIVMKVRTELTRMKKLLPRAHLEVMRGTPVQASEYCKKDGDYFEDGKLLGVDHRGGASGGNAKRARYTECIKAAKAGDFKRIEEDHPDMYWNSYHTMKRIAMDNPPPREDLKELNNIWIWGPPGVGKSRKARFDNPQHYVKSHNKWWLGYKEEKVVILDDLGKTDANWIGEYLKQWADHYPFPAETKGDGSLLRPEKIIVTSNYNIEELWSQDDSMIAALNRRFKVINMTDNWSPPEIIEIEESEDSVLDLTHLCNADEVSIDLDEL